MSSPLFAVLGLVAVAVVLAAVFIGIWALDAHRSKGEETDEERLDVNNG